ncbi:MAG: hypothetical protein IJ215_01390 [Clostridia bacterium]|nr:hypothetical protein [Clostridia bacterium]
MAKKKKKSYKKRKNNELTSLIVLVAIAICAIVGVSVYQNFKYTIAEKTGKYSKIKFSEMYETRNGVKSVSSTFNSFNGEMVELTGYMAVQSPLDESYVYLVNQPYVSCPFCAIGDVTKLEIIPVYMANGGAIKYTENGVTVRGTLEVAEKVDALEYTTQCRIIADKVTEIIDENADKELQAWYADLNNANMIIDMQTLQMDIEYATNEEYMYDYGTTKASVVDGIVSDFAGGTTTSEDGTELTNIESYLIYIKECPLIIAYYEPEREDLKELNSELIDIFDQQIAVMEKFTEIILEGKAATTVEEKEEIYDKLVALNSENIVVYDAFTAWNNKLRE